MKANYIYKRKDGGTTHCYGYVKETSNFSLVCENEYNDGIVADAMVTERRALAILYGAIQAERAKLKEVK